MCARENVGVLVIVHLIQFVCEDVTVFVASVTPLTRPWTPRYDSIVAFSWLTYWSCHFNLKPETGWRAAELWEKRSDLKKRDFFQGSGKRRSLCGLLTRGSLCVKSPEGGCFSAGQHRDYSQEITSVIIVDEVKMKLPENQKAKICDIHLTISSNLSFFMIRLAF